MPWISDPPVNSTNQNSSRFQIEIQSKTVLRIFSIQFPGLQDNNASSSVCFVMCYLCYEPLRLSYIFIQMFESCHNRLPKFQKDIWFHLGNY